jgi:S-adenosylmethionine synthetase
MMTRQIIVTPLVHQPIEEREIEMCEHKGIGHPDTIVDGICESSSRELSKSYLQTFGAILHHNLDKGLLVGGQSLPRFGGGRIVQPIKIIVCGRATALNGKNDIDKIVVEAARGYLEKNIRCDLSNFQITTEIRNGSPNLKKIFEQKGAVPLANDTSFGCGYAPYSRLEGSVLALSRVMKSPEFRNLFPAAGDDFKIMGHRVNKTLSFTLALAFVDHYVDGVEHYFAMKKAITQYLNNQLGIPAEIRMNCLDSPTAQNEDGLYLTVSGLSAEMGDDGQVGRGNRVNGLITPAREMSLEAAAGKNPLSHVGKIYNVLAMMMAKDIHEKIGQVNEVYVKLLSAIGERIDLPQVAAVEVSSKTGITSDLQNRIKAIAEEWFENMSRITNLILEEKVSLY